DSGDDFWNLVSAQPFAELKARPEARNELQRVFYFEQQPYVQRVIFLGTPHHGSKLAPSPPVRLLAHFIQAPRKVLAAARDVARENPTLWPGLGEGQPGPTVPNSIDLLTPGAPALELLAKRPAPPGVIYHSVIGEIYGHGESGTDGIVPYTSAHLDGVA